MQPNEPAAFVERRFDTPGGEVICRFRCPHPDGPDFRCDYEIAWPDRVRSSYGMGVDAVQALLLAMQKAHTDLLISPEREAGELRWLGQRTLGLPVADALRDLVEG